MVWVEEHDKRSFLLDLMDAAGLGAKDLDGEVSCLPSVHLDLDGLYCMRGWQMQWHGLISSPVFLLLLDHPHRIRGMVLEMIR